MARSYDQPASSEPLSIATEEELRANMRQISRRINANPALGRLLFVNPILVLEDVGVTLAPAVKQHIMGALRFPARRREQIARLEADIVQHASSLGITVSLPLGAQPRFVQVLKVERTKQSKPIKPTKPTEQVEQVEQVELPASLSKLLQEHAELSRGAVVFHPRETYNAFKRGERNHRWVKAIRFTL